MRLLFVLLRLVGLKRFLKNWTAEAEVSVSSMGNALAVVPLCSILSECCGVNCGCMQESLWTAGGSHGCHAGHLPRSSPSGVNRLGGHICCPWSSVKDLPSCLGGAGGRCGLGLWDCQLQGCTVPVHPAALPALSHNPVHEPTELHLKPVGRSGLLERLSQSPCFGS